MTKVAEGSGALPDRLRRVEGRHNPLVKELRQAFSRAELTDDGYCAIEGLRIIEEAIRSGLRFRAIFFRESAHTQAERVLPQIGAHAETILLPDKLFDSVVPSDSPQGVAALVHLKEFSIEDVLARLHVGPVVVLAGLQDPGNLGTIIRSAEAFGSAGVIMGEGTVSPINSKVVRASAGSIFRIAWLRGKLDAVSAKLHDQQIRLVATSSHKGTRLDQTDFTGSLALFVGSEGSGVPKNLMERMDEIVMIPHSERVESLNAGVAASVLLYEAARQRK